MKKSLIALAVLAASGAAMAQSSVTLYGIVDANVGYVNHAGATNKSVYGIGHSGNATSRLGFRGVEDLGGGLKAKFTLEGAILNDVGGGFDFKRESTVGLAGGFGEVRLGRELTPTFRAINKYDVFGATGVGRYLGFQDWSQAPVYQNAVAAEGLTQDKQDDVNSVRASNMITYATPNFNGFNASVAYAFDEKAGKVVRTAGRYAGAMVGYDNGPISVTAAYGSVKTSLAGVAADRDTYSIGGSYDFGMAKLSGMAAQTKYKADGMANAKFNSYMLGVSAPVGGVGEVKAQYALYDQKAFDTKAHQLSLGYVHNLSKRTALYATVAYLKNKKGSDGAVGSSMTLDAAGAYSNANTLGGVKGGQSQVGTQVGIRHSF